jgi:rhodanese-related sulfurtransferase
MGWVDAIKKALGRTSTTVASANASAGTTKEEAAGEDLRVPEVTSRQLMAEMESGTGEPLLLDIRENYERARALIPGSLHIPMNTIPYRLAELDPSRAIVVYCAHGNRSYGVSGWLIQQGYKARSLKGGIVDWQQQRGPVESGYQSRS